MRGRVNTDLYSGVSINATTDQFVVSGSNITAGDFVQYKYAGAEKKYFSNQEIQQTRKISGNYFISITGSLYKYENDTLTYVDSLPLTCSMMDKINDNHFVLSTSSGHWYFITVNTSTDKIVIEGEYDNSLETNDIHVINSNKLISIKPKAVGSSSTGYTLAADYIVFNISNVSNITILKNDSVNGDVFGYAYTSSGHYYSVLSNIIGVVNNKYIVTHTLFSTSVSRYSRAEFDNSTNSITKSTISEMGVINFDGKLVNMVNNLAHERFCFHIAVSSYPHIYVYDLLNMARSYSASFSDNDNSIMLIPGSGSSSGTYGVSEFDSNGEFYLSSGKMWSINYNAISKCKINTSGGLDVVAPKKNSNSALNSYTGPSINAGSKGVLMDGGANTGYYYKSLSIINGEIVYGEQTNNVERYDGTNPKMLMGVAATSGSVGNTIDVYKPLTSY